MTSTPGKDWTPVRRSDGELIGFLAESSAGWRPLTVFGHPIGDVVGREDAESRLHATGMSYLAEKWELRDGAHWITAQLVDFFEHADRYGERHTLAAPVGTDRLRVTRRLGPLRVSQDSSH